MQHCSNTDYCVPHYTVLRCLTHLDVRRRVFTQHLNYGGTSDMASPINQGEERKCVFRKALGSSSFIAPNSNHIGFMVNCGILRGQIYVAVAKIEVCLRKCSSRRWLSLCFSEGSFATLPHETINAAGDLVSLRSCILLLLDVGGSHLSAIKTPRHKFDPLHCTNIE